MKLKYNIVITQVGDQWIAAATGSDADKFKNVIFLNKVGAFIIECLSSEITQELLQKVADKYDGETDQIDQSITSFVKELKTLGLLD